MSALLLALLSLLGFIIAYFVYGKFISEKILSLDPNCKTPSEIKADGEEFVPTNSFVLFGHHFASIAGLGPILGPAIAVIWGWLPALLWVVFGTIFLGAVHDLVSLGISLRHEGRSIGDITKDILGVRARFLFLLIIYFSLALAMGVFALVIAQLFTSFHPQAVLPTFSLIFIAVLMGLAVYRWKVSLGNATAVGLIFIFASLFLGIKYPVEIYSFFLPSESKLKLEYHEKEGTFQKYCHVTDFGGALSLKEESAKLSPKILPFERVEKASQALLSSGQIPLSYEQLDSSNVSRMIVFFQFQQDLEMVRDLQKAAEKAFAVWVLLLLFYSFLASVLPVWILLQPRDYLNSFQLYGGGILLYGGLFIGAPVLVAPALNSHPSLPSIFPFLFITVACGAISGFHCLVASGTTVRQLKRETDATFVAYGGMLAEGALAVIVILACTAGFPSTASWNYFYREWSAANSLGAQLAAFINGSGSFLSHLGIPLSFGKTFIAVVVVGFAMTTLDSATRLLRYNIEEIASSAHLKAAAMDKVLASFLAVASIGFFAFMKFNGQPAGRILWGLFGTINQLLGGISLLVVSIYLYQKNKPILYTLLPMVFMLVMTLTAMTMNWFTFLSQKNIPLILVGAILMAMTIWLCLEALLSFLRSRREKKQIHLF